jgi:hypothetical protein
MASDVAGCVLLVSMQVYDLHANILNKFSHSCGPQPPVVGGSCGNMRVPPWALYPWAAPLGQLHAGYIWLCCIM